jgi:hypothetical protein
VEEGFLEGGTSVCGLRLRTYPLPTKNNPPIIFPSLSSPLPSDIHLIEPSFSQISSPGTYWRPSHLQRFSNLLKLAEIRSHTINMSDVTETKPDPTTIAPEETTKPAETTTTETSKTEEVKAAAESAAETATETVKDAAAKTSDSVFSMFGGGPKKEKKEDEEEADEPSGSSKAKKAEDEVSYTYHCTHPLRRSSCLCFVLFVSALSILSRPEATLMGVIER